MFPSTKCAGFAVLPLVILIALSDARDEPSGYVPLEPSLRSTYPWNVTDEEIRNLPLDAPLLREMYATISRIHERMVRTNPDYKPLIPVLDDLRRRGNEATPLLLDIMEHNHNTDVEYLLPRTAAGTGTINMEPYLEYLRKAMRTRPQEINWSAAEVATTLFLRFGAPEDIEMMLALGRERPFLADAVECSLKKQNLSAARREEPPRGEGDESVNVEAGANAPDPEPPSSPATTGNKWLDWAAAGLALAGLLALALRRRVGAGADR